MRIKSYKLVLVDDDGNETTLVPAASEIEQPEPSIYAEDGFSQEMKYGVCVRWKEYDDLLDEMLATGDEFDVRTANEAKRWLCVWLPTREYSDEQLKIIKFHFNRGMGSWFGGKILNHFGFYPNMEDVNDRDLRAPDAFTPCTTWDYKQVQPNLNLLLSNIRNRAAHYRQRGTPGAPQVSPGGSGA